MTTSTPGKFKWQPGVLTTAVTEGKWILVEDINLAPVDVLAVLIPLLETRWLHIPSRGERHRAKEGFRMFATRSFSKSAAEVFNTVGENLWHKIDVPPLLREDLNEILQKRFPNLQEYLSIILDVYLALLEECPKVSGGRPICVRDLMKWCTRASKTLSRQMDLNAIHELLFREAMDCFCGMIPQATVRTQFAVHIGKSLELTEHRIEYYMNHHVPVVEQDAKSIRYGRVVLPIVKTGNSNDSPFATTSTSLRNLERIAACTALLEPILLVGETGTGKTTIVQRLASQLGHKLIVINMSQQSDSTDLLGGFKPVDAVMLASPLKEKFDNLFAKTFSVKQNRAFLDSIAKTYIKQKWNTLVTGFNNAIQMAKKVAEQQSQSGVVADKTKKSKKTIESSVFREWEDFSNHVRQFKQQIQQIQSQFLFSFVEGSLVKAIKNGHWILLDEINLATQETLECLSGLLQNATSSIMLLERGDTSPIVRHPDFRLFACMNPANDAGKRNLQSGFRSRFTEFWIDSPDTTRTDLILIIKSYLFRFIPPGPPGHEICDDVASFYTKAKDLASQGFLFDGADCKVHISMRTLTRALSAATYIAPVYGIRRALYEGCYMTFMTGLNPPSFTKLKELMYAHVLNTVRNPTAFIRQIPQVPNVDEIEDRFELIDCFWIEKGPLDIPEDVDNQFVLTPSVQVNLANLARGCLSRKYPILIQGPTSAGKTSMIEYLAKKTGHRFIRINNHEHTDLQEYLGGYMSNSEGVLVFQEGVLVEALRKGYWVVLDELNLAPSDVLEALNRLLDDNRELFLAEKQEVIKPHPHFMLFATQNPAGQYGGRKQLSRAFRNRFLELHFTDIPENELETIIEKRCQIAPSYAKKLVTVYKALCKTRDASKIFDGRQSFITLRDLFRWALRRATGYQRLAEDGYMLLAERVRKIPDRLVIKDILEKELKVKLDMDALYKRLFQEIIQPYEEQPEVRAILQSVVWTTQMKKLLVLIYTCKLYSEPILLIGETGCGKTTVCQILARICNQKLHIVNAHQNSETSDFLGSQRPSRNRDQYESRLKEILQGLLSESKHAQEFAVPSMELPALESLVQNLKKEIRDRNELFQQIDNLIAKAKSLFEWHDGPLVQAMLEGDFFLLDEISLADDSVLERLNSVLEPSRKLTLVEKNGSDVAEITAATTFHFFATMNPGGDYGKKELSPALRNRFTEIWVPQISDMDDLRLIIQMKLKKLGDISKLWSEKILEFLCWFATQLGKSVEAIVSLRDILAWSTFVENVSVQIGLEQAYLHGGCMVLVDGIGVNPLFGNMRSAAELAIAARHQLFSLAGLGSVSSELSNVDLSLSEHGFGAPPFFIPYGDREPENINFSLQAPTTLQNCLRVLRAIQLNKPVLLEGSPGAGKTSIISSMASMSRHGLVRINLSEQTDLMDLFGSDLPVEGGSGGEFAWRDGPFLKAMQSGEWVLLDELNLASQQVLEGLNACLDHRATVYIPELDRHFACHPDFRVFAAQNPQSQGGGRKGLPKSFVNRFTLVYVEELSDVDLRVICGNLYPHFDPAITEKMINFNQQMKYETMDIRKFGWMGSPWEFNLRDVLRWLDLWKRNPHSNPEDFVGTLYVQRMRCIEDRKAVVEIFVKEFGYVPSSLATPSWMVSPSKLIIGSQVYHRTSRRGLHKYGVPIDHLQVLPSSLNILESLLHCVNSRTMGLLIGPAASGKSSLVRLLAGLCGEKLEEFSMNPGVDALEILGGFEQVDLIRCEKEIFDSIEAVVENLTRRLLVSNSSFESIANLNGWMVQAATVSGTKAIALMRQMLEFLRSLNLDFGEFELDKIAEKVRNYEAFAESDARGRFEWMDSTLVRALEYGHWLLIDNVNLCSSSVLDRLNSLLEVGGTLIMNERGLVNDEIKVIQPHPNFRIFMAMDPKHGEISRAMRNRAIELYVPDFEFQAHSLQSSAVKILTQIGLPGKHFANEFVHAETRHSINHYRIVSEKINHGLFEGNLDIALRYPTSHPDHVSGKLWKEHSSMCQVLQAGSILLHLAMNTPFDFVGVKSVDRIPKPSVLMDASVLFFFQQLNSANTTMMNSWYKFMNKYSKNQLPSMSSVLDNDNPILIGKILKSRASLLEAKGMSAHDQMLPIDLKLSTIQFSDILKIADYEELLEILCIRRNSQLLRLRIAQSCSRANETLDGEKKIIQVSYLAHHQKIRIAALTHPGIQYLYPLLESLIQFVFSSMDLDLTRLAIDISHNLWIVCQEIDLNFSMLTLVLKDLLELLQSSDTFSPELHQLGQALSMSFKMEKYDACSKLWNNTSTVSFVNKSLWFTGFRLERLNDEFDFWRMSPQSILR
jgi:midasin